VKYLAHERRVYRRDSGKIAGHRRPRYHPRRFPGLAAAVGKLTGRALVLNGEVAIYDQQLRSRFEWPRERDQTSSPRHHYSWPSTLPYCDRRDLTGRPLRERRTRLEDVVAGSELVFPVRRLTSDGLEAWKQVVERGYEGYVAKDSGAHMMPDRRWPS
jgi:ATP-dependent DNA ligase